MNYEQLSSLGITISRGQLETGFDAENPSTVDHQSKFGGIDYAVSSKVKPPKLPGFKPKPITLKQRLSKLKKCEPHMRRFYERLYNRGMTVVQLADLADCSVSVVHRCLAGNRVPPKVKDGLSKILKPDERKELGWKA